MSDPDLTVDQPHPPVVTPASATSAATSAALPTQIGRYRVERVLGRGRVGGVGGGQRRLLLLRAVGVREGRGNEVGV